MDRGVTAGVVLVLVMAWFAFALPVVIYVNTTGHLPW